MARTPSLAAADFNFGRAPGADFEGAFAAPAAARDLGLDGSLGERRIWGYRQAR